MLLDKDKGILKIANLGLGRAFTVPLKSYVHEIVTLWYRAPQVPLGRLITLPLLTCGMLVSYLTRWPGGKRCFPEILSINSCYISLGTVKFFLCVLFYSGCAQTDLF